MWGINSLLPKHMILIQGVHSTIADKNACPIVKALLILFKYKPYRQILHKIVKKSPLGQRSLRAMLHQTVKECAQIKPNVLVPWKKNAGRQVSHHHGFLATMQDLGILKKLKSKRPLKDIQFAVSVCECLMLQGCVFARARTNYPMRLTTSSNGQRLLMRS